jgi:hypothetical protein
MNLPTVTETPLALVHTERDDFADDTPTRRHGENAEQYERRPRKPQREPYRRASQRELVRASLDSYMHTHAYDRESA